MQAVPIPQSLHCPPGQDQLSPPLLNPPHSCSGEGAPLPVLSPQLRAADTVSSPSSSSRRTLATMPHSAHPVPLLPAVSRVALQQGSRAPRSRRVGLLCLSRRAGNALHSIHGSALADEDRRVALQREGGCPPSALAGQALPSPDQGRSTFLGRVQQWTPLCGEGSGTRSTG